MKNTGKEYTFLIDNLTPESTDFGRLVDYYRQLKGMFSGIDGIHLTAITEGSHSNTLLASTMESADSFEARVSNIRNGTATAKVMKHCHRLQEMLSEDSSEARIDGFDGHTIALFPAKPKEPEIEFINDHGNFVGAFFGMEGKSLETVTVKVMAEIYGEVKFDVPKHEAIKLKDNLFEHLRFHGKGDWGKAHDGKKSLKNFSIEYYEVVKKTSLMDAIQEIHDLNLDWKDDPLKYLRDLNNDAVTH